MPNIKSEIIILIKFIFAAGAVLVGVELVCIQLPVISNVS